MRWGIRLSTTDDACLLSVGISLWERSANTDATKVLFFENKWVFVDHWDCTGVHLSNYAENADPTLGFFWVERDKWKTTVLYCKAERTPFLLFTVKE